MQKSLINKGQTLINLLSPKRMIFILLFTSIACLRFYYCTQLPVNTGDILRHIYYGLYTEQRALATAGQGLAELNPLLSWVSWASLPYNYPIVTLLFFIVIGKLSPTIFFSKFVLTLVEALNSWLVFKYSRQRLLALLFWASPISIWWVSHEGQFEPLQSLFVIGALCTLSKRKSLAFILLALAVQVKLTAILLLPYFVISVRRDNPNDLIMSLTAFAMGFLPTGFAMFHYPIITQMLSSATHFIYNPYYWNVLKYTMFLWNPWWLVAFNQLATYGMLILLATWTVKLREIKSFFAPMSFIVFCKITYLCQFWYFVLHMSFLLPIQDKRKRLWLFALTPLLDVRSSVQILSGPFGYTVGKYYETMDVFMKLII
jgi:hypothetical protein